MPQDTPTIEARQRALLTLWFALFFSLGLYLVFTQFGVTPSEKHGNPVFSFGFAAVATLTVILSFPIKQRLLKRSIEKQDPGLVQPAFVVAWAMCEVSAILGIVEYFLLGTRDYLVLFLLAAAGMILHFPTRQHLLNASYKNQ